MANVYEVEEHVSKTRNSKMRNLSQNFTYGIARTLDKYVPQITPDMLSAASAILPGAAAFLAQKNYYEGNSQLVPAALTVLGTGCDGIDGPLARTKLQTHPEQINPNGANVDAGCDRAGEALQGLARIHGAYQRKDIPGVIAATAATLTSPIPSIERAYAETKGKCVPETGKTIVTFLGTRAGRFITQTAATLFPEVRGVHTQTIFDTVTTVANTATAIERLKIIRNNDPALQELDDKDQQKAKSRFKVLAAVGTLTAGAVIFSHLQHNNHKPPHK